MEEISRKKGLKLSSLSVEKVNEIECWDWVLNVEGCSGCFVKVVVIVLLCCCQCECDCVVVILIILWYDYMIWLYWDMIMIMIILWYDRVYVIITSSFIIVSSSDHVSYYVSYSYSYSYSNFPYPLPPTIY